MTDILDTARQQVLDVGNYLTTLGRPAAQDLAMLERLQMPVKALGATL